VNTLEEGVCLATVLGQLHSRTSLLSPLTLILLLFFLLSLMHSKGGKTCRLKLASNLTCLVPGQYKYTLKEALKESTTHFGCS